MEKEDREKDEKIAKMERKAREKDEKIAKMEKRVLLIQKKERKLRRTFRVSIALLKEVADNTVQKNGRRRR